jgi:uncharacterized membrane protein (DUF485 family)
MAIRIDAVRRSERFEGSMPSNINRTGLGLFAAYLAAYGGFVALNAFSPETMRTPVYQGVNLAIVYGMGLIIGAFVLAVIYAWVCGNGNRHTE